MSCITSHNSEPFKVEKKFDLSKGKDKIKNPVLDKAKRTLSAIKGR